MFPPNSCKPKYDRIEFNLHLYPDIALQILTFKVSVNCAFFRLSATYIYSFWCVCVIYFSTILYYTVAY